MHRIDHATRQQNKFGVGRDGFTGGNPATQVPATIVTADWLDAIQEEIARAIELDPSIAPLAKANNGQLAALIQTYGKLTAANAWTQRQRFNAGYFSRVQSLQHTATDLDFANDDGVPVRRGYWKTIPLCSARPHDNVNAGNTHTTASWLYMGAYWRSTGVGSYIDIPLVFNNQSVLDSYAVLLGNGNASSANIYASIRKKTYVLLSPVLEEVIHEAPMVSIAPGSEGFVGAFGLFLASANLGLHMDSMFSEYVIRLQCVRDMVYLRHTMAFVSAPGYRTH